MTTLGRGKEIRLRRVLLVLSILLLALLGLQWLAGGRRDRAQPVAPEVAPRPESRAATELATPEAVESPEPARSPAGETASETVTPTAPAAPAAESVAGVTRLRGVLRFSGDGRPAPNEPLAFFQGENQTTTVTDGQGRFETEPIAWSGIAWVSHVVEDHALRLETEPSKVLVPEGEDGEFSLTLLEPARLRVQVFARGVPAPAAVSGSAQRSFASAQADARGLCELQISRILPGDELALWADGESLRSERTKLAFPWPDELVRLDLVPTGRVLARVRDASGRAQSGRDVAVEEGPRAATDAEGVARLAPVLSGLRRVVTRGTEQEVIVPAGGEVEVELVVPATEVVAAGLVLDERGEGVDGVDVDLENEQGSDLYASAPTDEFGRFEIRAEAGQAQPLVRVSVGGGVEGDSYEPHDRLVPAGTRDLVFRRLESPEILTLAVAVLDARTQLPLERAQILLFRTAWPQEWDSYGARGGVQTVTFRPYDDMRIVARSPEHLDRTVAWSEVPEDARAGKPLRIELEPGFEREVEVLDEPTLAPIAGARILAGDELVATTDVRGRALVRLAAWPASLRAEAAGHTGVEYDRNTLLCELEASFRLARGE